MVKTPKISDSKNVSRDKVLSLFAAFKNLDFKLVFNCLIIYVMSNPVFMRVSEHLRNKKNTSNFILLLNLKPLSVRGFFISRNGGKEAKTFK